MFRLNRLTDYAVVVMTQMTRRPIDVHTGHQGQGEDEPHGQKHGGGMTTGAIGHDTLPLLVEAVQI